jgi:hypothetical protein
MMSDKVSIRIDIGGLILGGWVRDQGTGALLLQSMPIEFPMSRWGDEYYGGIGLDASCEGEMVEVVEVGDLAYWPTGDALSVFFGPTPASQGDEPRAASPVCVLGHVDTDPQALRGLPPTVTARLES